MRISRDWVRKIKFCRTDRHGNLRNLRYRRLDIIRDVHRRSGRNFRLFGNRSHIDHSWCWLWDSHRPKHITGNGHEEDEVEKHSA